MMETTAVSDHGEECLNQYFVSLRNEISPKTHEFLLWCGEGVVKSENERCIQRDKLLFLELFHSVTSILLLL